MTRTWIILFFCLVFWSGFAVLQLDRQAFYKTLSSGDEASIDKAIAGLEKQKLTSRVSAYKGALMMKKAGFIKGAKGKVKTFKEGAALLENEIKGSPDNMEYRFLRLTVQENAPKILKYNKQLDEDKQAIVSNFDKLESDLKAVISDYAKHSKVLQATDLK
ncbi:hypothetical protein [Dyadobacter sp. CY326]|uniref:hypothetical protein n=1 Tax=Dyadobacter sp. CY326 TaxID=2907300 RepID=UPI001F41BDA8|nr:hypothetical protein [Dyadobacter sp. CY326]MCE7064140.1 hypothetical protein [Dyadobacter sp. CY326]